MSIPSLHRQLLYFYSCKLQSEELHTIPTTFMDGHFGVTVNIKLTSLSIHLFILLSSSPV